MNERANAYSPATSTRCFANPGEFNHSRTTEPKFRIQDNSSVIETYANKFLGSAFDGSAINSTVG